MSCLSVKWWSMRLAQEVSARVPQRIVLSTLGFMAIVHAYTMRHSMEIMLKQLAKETAKALPARTIKIQTRASFVQRFQLRNATLANAPSPQGLSPEAMFNIEMFFYIGYALSHLPSCKLAQCYEGKCTLFLAIFITTLLTLCTPTALCLGGPLTLVGISFLMGLTEGAVHPALCMLLVQWVPARERGTLGALALSGSLFGRIVLNVFTSVLQNYFHSSFVCYFFGGWSVLWLISFCILAYNEPGQCPFIGEREMAYLRSELSATPIQSQAELTPTPWAEIFKNLPTWALIAGTAQYEWMRAKTEIYQRVNNEAPFLLCGDIDYNSDTFIIQILNWLVFLLAGCLADALISRGWSRTNARKLMTAIAAVGPTLFTGVYNCFSCNNRLSFAGIFSGAVSIMSACHGGLRLIPLDMSPNYAATVMAIANSVASVTYVLQQYLKHTKYIDRMQNFPCSELGIVIWVFCITVMSGEVQAFNNPATTPAHRT